MPARPQRAAAWVADNNRRAALRGLSLATYLYQMRIRHVYALAANPHSPDDANMLPILRRFRPHTPIQVRWVAYWVLRVRLIDHGATTVTEICCNGTDEGEEEIALYWELVRAFIRRLRPPEAAGVPPSILRGELGLLHGQPCEQNNRDWEWITGINLSLDILLRY